MRYLDDRRLYSDTRYCLDVLRSLPAARDDSAPAGKTLFHIYWYGDFGPLQALSVKSFLATQDRERTELWLWLDAAAGHDDHRRNPYLGPLLPALTVKRFDPVDAAEGTPLAVAAAGNAFQRWRRRSYLSAPRSLVERSNVFRLITLYRHGGVYGDIDLLYLRDLRDLRGLTPATEFCYRNSEQAPIQNAVLALDKGGATAASLLRAGLRSLRYRPPLGIRYETAAPNLLVLPAALFDPLWLPSADSDHPFERFADFFTAPATCGPAEFYRGAFAYHWHHHWDVAWHPESFAARFDAELDAILGDRYGIVSAS